MNIMILLETLASTNNIMYLLCSPKYFGRYLTGQGRSMTFQQNCVRPITLLFEVRFYNYFWKHYFYVSNTYSGSMLVCYDWTNL